MVTACTAGAAAAAVAVAAAAVGLMGAACPGAWVACYGPRAAEVW